MQEIKKVQNEVFSSLCEDLNKRHIAAILEGEEEKYLSVMINGLPVEQDVFMDIAFVPAATEMKGISFCVLESRFPDYGDFTPEETAELSVALSVLNSELTAGSYYFNLSEDEDDSIKAGELIYRYTIPVVPEYSVEKFTETINRGLDMAFFDLKNTLSPLFSLINKESTGEEFIKTITA
ncbi:MAG: hypothetical protein J6N76_02100 [Lachnospiraceae bacterium]|nr:hypothetical protein [Lachnospiraceae bacterium]